MEDITFSEICTVKPIEDDYPLNNKPVHQTSIIDLEKQLSRFNVDQKVQEAQTHSYLAKVNARITSNISSVRQSSENVYAGDPGPKIFNNFVATNNDNPFILQKNLNFYFPAVEEGQ